MRQRSHSRKYTQRASDDDNFPKQTKIRKQTREWTDCHDDDKKYPCDRTKYLVVIRKIKTQGECEASIGHNEVSPFKKRSNESTLYNTINTIDHGYDTGSE